MMRLLVSVQHRGFVSYHFLQEAAGPKLSGVYTTAILSDLRASGEVFSLPSSIFSTLPEGQKPRSNRVYLPSVKLLNRMFSYTREHDRAMLPVMLDSVSRTLIAAAITASDRYPVKNPLVKAACAHIIQKEPDYVCNLLARLSERDAYEKALCRFFSGDSGAHLTAELMAAIPANPMLFWNETKTGETHPSPLYYLKDNHTDGFRLPPRGRDPPTHSRGLYWDKGKKTSAEQKGPYKDRCQGARRKYCRQGNR